MTIKGTCWIQFHERARQTVKVVQHFSGWNSGSLSIINNLVLCLKCQMKIHAIPISWSIIWSSVNGIARRRQNSFSNSNLKQKLKHIILIYLELKSEKPFKKSIPTHWLISLHCFYMIFVWFFTNKCCLDLTFWHFISYHLIKSIETKAHAEFVSTKLTCKETLSDPLKLKARQYFEVTITILL